MGSESSRLQKFLAGCGLGSRRACEDLITAGRVSVNGVKVTELGSKVEPARDKVVVDGALVRQEPKGILLLHKPKNVVSTMSDPEGRPTVADYLTRNDRSYFPVGRLDFESEGLVIMTNDGELADQLLHPRYQIARVYAVQVAGRVPDGVFEKLERGLKLEDGLARGKVGFVEDKGEFTLFELTVLEGRNRLVRRMCEAVGFPVVRLVRSAHGPFSLGSLRPGQKRRYTEREYQQAVAKVAKLVEQRVARDERRFR